MGPQASVVVTIEAMLKREESYADGRERAVEKPCRAGIAYTRNALERWRRGAEEMGQLLVLLREELAAFECYEDGYGSSTIRAAIGTVERALGIG